MAEHMGMGCRRSQRMFRRARRLAGSTLSTGKTIGWRHACVFSASMTSCVQAVEGEEFERLQGEYEEFVQQLTTELGTLRDTKGDSHALLADLRSLLSQDPATAPPLLANQAAAHSLNQLLLELEVRQDVIDRAVEHIAQLSEEAMESAKPRIPRNITTGWFATICYGPPADFQNAFRCSQQVVHHASLTSMCDFSLDLHTSTACCVLHL
jgi:hypothetical protein